MGTVVYITGSGGGGLGRVGDPTVGGGTYRPVKYVTGWRDTEQDRRPPPRVARIISQDYDVIKRECLAQQALWEDPNFPATDKSIYPSATGPLPFKWKRPGELCSDPRMFVDGFARGDIIQGDLGNCWFLAAAASLCVTRDKELFHKVVPLDNLFIKDYTGTFHFKIWQYGKWVDVVIDDRLPTLNGRLKFVHSNTNNEFWPALLEKAYAKLNGSYEALSGGSSGEAMEDFTGGVTETFDLNKELPKDMFTIMKKAFERKSLMCCVADPDPARGQAIGTELPNGLICGHAYSVTGVRDINIRGQKINLLRIRNPWGNEAEWKGAWSDGSPEWKYISEQDRAQLGLTFEDDGEFWMTFSDMCAHYTKLDICMITPALETLADSHSRRTWKQVSYEGTWIRGVNAGGCPNHKATFWTNPQYRVEVIDPDENDDDNTGTLVVALMQKEPRKKKQEGRDMLYIGYMIYKIDAKTSGPLDATYFRYNVSVQRSPSFINTREVVGRHKLPPGSYVIVPCTYNPHQEGDFLLRIFSENKANMQEMDEQTDLIENRLVKVKEEIPVFENENGGGTKVVKGRVLPDSELLRQKISTVTSVDVDEERQLREMFKQTSGPDLEVDAYELRAILEANFKSEFTLPNGIGLETCRSMVAMMDVDHSGKLGYEEFKKLWMDLRRWKKVFKEFDRLQTSSLDSFELRAALNSAGFRVSNQTFKCLVMRFSDPKGQLYFDDFILCAVRLKSMFETFKSIAKDENKPASFQLDEFIQTTMYS